MIRIENFSRVFQNQKRKIQMNRLSFYYRLPDVEKGLYTGYYTQVISRMEMKLISELLN